MTQRVPAGSRSATRLRALMIVAGILSIDPVHTCLADGPSDNVPEKVRPIPPAGIQISAADRKELEQGLAKLDKAVQELSVSQKYSTAQLLPDVQVFQKAVHNVLTYNEFIGPDDVKHAKAALEEGNRRAEQLLAGNAPWETKTGLVVRGYVSKIDGSVQPYGLFVPETYAVKSAVRHPVDIWFHGRQENLTEVNFIDERTHNRGEFTPPDTIVLHPYGRYCNAFKFAGEVDVLEALESVKQRYRVDDERIAVRGFSMGGAATWHFAVHYPTQWVAANPGAGFAETPQFLKVFQSETVEPTEIQKKLWHLYDCNDWAVNIFNLPTVAYSGEIDPQKQAADVMAAALDGEGITLRHIIGPGTKHKYHPEAKKTVEGLMASIVEAGRTRYLPELRFTTYTLRYNQCGWVTVDGLWEHWKPARIEGNFPTITTDNVERMTLEVPAGHVPDLIPDLLAPVQLTIDMQQIEGPRPMSDRSWSCRLRQVNGTWQLEPKPDDELRKRHGLQGPIDDAFMDSFVFVRPTGATMQPAVDTWAKSELERAIREWRRQFRGEARVIDDTKISDRDIVSANLVLWGTPQSNAVLKKIADRLPIHWEADAITLADQKFAADQNALIMIYPNPLNPKRYVVLNSGFTYREYDYLNNARQVPRLPDWAIIDVRTPPSSQWPGRIAAMDFFDERWQLKK